MSSTSSTVLSTRDRDRVKEERRRFGGELLDAVESRVTLEEVPARRDLENSLKRRWDPRYDLRAAYAQFLERWRWDWLATLTFETDTHPEAARKKFMVWIDRMNKQAFGKRYRNRTKGIYWARAAEFQRRGTLHYHTLMSAPEDLNLLVSRKDARNHWYELAGIARVDPIRRSPGAVTTTSRNT